MASENNNVIPSAAPSAVSAAPMPEPPMRQPASAPAPAPRAAAPMPVTAIPAAPGTDDDGDFVTDQPNFVPGLSPSQEKALAALLDGKSATHAAVMVGVSRVTIYRWQYHDPNFAAALNLCRRQARDQFATRVSAMQEEALSALGNLLKKQDFRALKLVFSFLATERIGPATPRGITRRLARSHEKAAAAALGQLLKTGQMPLKICAELEHEFFKHHAEKKKLESKPRGNG